MKTSKHLTLAVIALTTMLLVTLSLACTATEEADQDADTSAELDADTTDLADADSPGDPPFPLCNFTKENFHAQVFGGEPPINVTNMDGPQEVQGTVVEVSPGKWRLNTPQQIEPIFIQFQIPSEQEIAGPGNDAKIFKRDFREYADVSLYEYAQLWGDDGPYLQGGDIFDRDFEGRLVTPEPIFDATQIRPTNDSCAMLHRAYDGFALIGECWITFTPMDIALRTDPVVWAKHGQPQVVPWKGRDYHILIDSYHLSYARTCPDYHYDPEESGFNNYDYEVHVGLALLIE